MGVGGKCHAIISFSQGKSSVSILVSAPSIDLPGVENRTNFPPLGLEPRTVHLAVSHYTEGAIPASVWWTYLLTARCRVLPEHLTGLQLDKKFPAFHGTWRFITAHTSVRHLSLSWASPIHSTYPHPTSWRSILILSNHLRLGLPILYGKHTNKFKGT